ncbi:hypothetical protein EGW08_001583 [Elysia chlorotica]|uniref:Uncharacterized protein n=1 Tax=Elysia chlorotica TaxID=188477 RepID=A0A3S1I215_ELYCH|nr:hypothetical protein EGW08_001583 [Elysia chlorotica]
MKAASVCRMREAFLEECRRHDYVIPSTASRTPVLDLGGLEKLIGDDVIDKSTVATSTSAIQESLSTTDQQISQLCQQLKGQLFTKGFLIRVLAVLCGDSVDVSEVHTTHLALQVDEINKALVEAIAADKFRFCTSGREIIACQTVCSTSNEHLINSGSKSEVVRSGSVNVRRLKPTPAVRSKCKSSLDVSHTDVTIDPLRANSDLSLTKSTNVVVTDPTVDSIDLKSEHVFSDSSLSKTRDPCSEDAKVCRNLQEICDSSVECGNNTQMIDGCEDEESPYDNVLSLQEYLTTRSTMFRRKKSNASRADLDRGSLSSKDNFLAITSKHVPPSDIPRSQESTTQSPRLGRDFQMLKMTQGFDFVLDDSVSATQQPNGDSVADRENSGESEAKTTNSDNVVDSLAPAGQVSPAESPNIDRAKNRQASHNDSKRNDDIRDHASSSPTPLNESDRNQGHETERTIDEERRDKAILDLERESRASVTVIQVTTPQGTSGPRNEPSTSSADSHRLTPSAPPAHEVLLPASAHSHTGTETSARSDSSQAASTSSSTPATAATAPVGERSQSQASEEKTSGCSPGASVRAGTPVSSTCSGTSGTMDASHNHRPVPLRSPPKPRGNVTSVPPPVAKKTFRSGSGKAGPPVPGFKPAMKPSQSAHAQLVSATADQTASHKPERIDENSVSITNVNFGKSHSHSSPVASPALSKSKSPNPIGTAPKPGSELDGRRGSVNGIAELFGGKNRVQSHKSHQNDSVTAKSSGGEVCKANKTSRGHTTSPLVPARKLVSETTNSLGENTHPETNTCDQVAEEVASLKPDTPRHGKCVAEGDAALPALHSAVRHSLVAADAVAWPTGLNHPNLEPHAQDGNTHSADRQEEEAGGISDLVGRSRSSLISIHARLHRGGTLPTDSETDSAEGITSFQTLEDTIERDACGTPEERRTSASRMFSQDSVDTIVNSGEEGELGKTQEFYRDRSVSFTSDQDVKEAVLCLDAILGSEPLDDTLNRHPSIRLSTASTTSSVASNPRSSSTPSSPVSFRRQVSDGSAERRKSSMAGYENWTINRAVTRLITSTPDFDYSSDDDADEEAEGTVEGEVDDGLSEVSGGVSSPCLMKRDGPAKLGSKDSGLCDDISLTSESGHVTTTSGTDGGVGGVLSDGKIRDLSALRLLTERAAQDEDELEAGGGALDTHNKTAQALRGDIGDQDMDSISVASDILFIPGSRGGSRIRKYQAAQENLPEEDEDGDHHDSDVQEEDLVRPETLHYHDGDGGSGRAVQKQQRQEDHAGHHQRDHHHKMADESSSCSPDWQRPMSGEGKARLSREMSDSISITSSGEDEEPHSITMDSSYDETDSAREGMLKMRQLLVKGVLDSEKVYLDILTVLINYKKLLEENSESTQPVISREDVGTIFSNIETIYRIHNEFVTSLEPKVKDWHHEESIGEIFKIMISKFIDFGNYLTNYALAVSTIHRCSQGNERFQELAQKIVLTSTVKESSSLEDALFKPVQRVQRNTLVLHDLIKYTPQDHPDHEALQKALKLSHHILETFATAVPKCDTTKENRRLVKSSFLVELVNGVRKLRYVFLFSDVLVCTKRETHRNNKVTFDPKWFTPLSEATFDTKFDYTDDTKHSKRDDIDQLKSKLRALKKEMRAEMKKFDDKDKHRSLVSLGGATRVVEKLRKKISQYEAQLIIASPKLPFKASLNGGKVYTLLMTTDYEREEWKETIHSLCSRTSQNAPVMSSIFVQDLINSVKETPQVNKIGSVLLQKDEDILSGTLNVTVHKMNGLTEDCDTYCCLEMDSFGHFFMKARTHICEGTRDPAWNEDFELELESSQTLRFLCFRRGETGGDSGDIMLGRGAIELSKQWLKGSFQEKTVSMNEISLVVSVRHTPAEKTMQRTPSKVSAACFGVKITSLARREGKTVPTIVTACLQEVEKRGLDEVGIYRVSGVTSELQRIKKLFDKNVRSGAASLTDVDINAVTGILKLYFRELPEPLFTEACYQNFIDTLKLQDEEAKAQCMLSLLHGLPDTNYYTIVTLMEHLIKVARNVGENKMSIHNLSTIFGPTLLAPATNQAASDPLEMMCKGAEQVLRQSGVVNYLLGLAVSGRSLRRSS